MKSTVRAAAGTFLVLSTFVWGTATAQVQGSGEAYSARLFIGGASVFEAGDTAADGTESATNPGEFFDREEGVIIPADPLATVNAGPSTTRGNIRDSFDEVPDSSGVVLPPNFIKSESGETTATVLPAQLPGLVSLIDAVTRGSEVTLDCNGFTANSEVELLVVAGMTVIAAPSTAPTDVVGPPLSLIQANQTRVDAFDRDPNDGDACGISVTQEAVRVNVVDPVMGPVNLSLTPRRRLSRTSVVRAQFSGWRRARMRSSSWMPGRPRESIRVISSPSRSN